MKRRDVQVTVPVLGSDPVKTQAHFPLMPCHPARARQLKRKGARARWFRGVYAIQLTHLSEGNKQKIVCGIDPGVKREAFTVQSEKHTYLNILSDSVCTVSYRISNRKFLRQSRRHRKTPYRAPRSHRRPQKKWLAPTVRSKWELKLNIIKYLRKLFPITDIVIEDVAARKFVNRRRWNKNFGVLEIGKTEYYEKFSKIGTLKLVKGYDTAARRAELGLKKIRSKLSESFNAHNVDSWVLASMVTNRTEVDNKNMLRIVPLRFYRRKLHLMNPPKGGKRKVYGGTMLSGLRKGQYIKHIRYGLLYVSGGTDRGIAFSNPSTGDIERQYCTPDGYDLLYYSPWRTNWVGNIIVVPKTDFVGGHSLRDPAVRLKGQETKKALYGDPNFTNRDKAEETCLKKYGVSNPSQIEEVKKRAVQTLIARYGRVVNYDWEPLFKKDMLIDLHVNRKLSLREISDLHGVSPEVVSYWMKKHNIPVTRRIMSPVTKEYLSERNIVEDYFQNCVENNRVLSFYDFGKLKGNKYQLRLKRLFNSGKSYAHLKEELFQIALSPDRWPEFLKHLS